MGHLKLSWNKHFPGSDKMMLCGQKHQNYEFHRFKIYCTISSHISIGRVHTSQAWIVSTEAIRVLCNYTHMKCDPSVSCGCVDEAGDNDDSGEEGKLFTAVAWFPFEDCVANSNEAIIPFCSWTLTASLSSELVLGLWFATVVTLCKLMEKNHGF